MDNTSDQPKHRIRRHRLRRELTFPQLVMIGVVGALGNGALFGTIEIVIDERNGATELMLARVSRQSADYLSADPSVARKYEDELTSMLEKI